MLMNSRQPFYQVLVDFSAYADQWFLDDPRSAAGQEIDARDFTEGLPYKGPTPVAIPVMQAGREVAFSLSSFDMPVVSSAVVEIIERLAPGEAEFFPVQIKGAKHQYQILNAICRADCLDEPRSEFTMWTEEDNNPEMMGNYKMISTIRIDPARTSGHHIFRIARWPLALLVSDQLKRRIEDIPDLGVVFESVV
jgi:molybdopterin-guanine dinucleotide biosynthesis protein A